MGQVEFTVSAKDIKSAVKESISKPVIALGQNPVLLRQIAEKALQIVTPYVPRKDGFLRDSGHVVQHARKTQVKWGVPGIGRTMIYAGIQFTAPSTWKRTTDGTMSYWTDMIEPGTRGYAKLISYATPLVKKGVKKRGR